MRSDPRNPAANIFPPGIDEKEFIAAVEASGYPLQGVVASKLLPVFSVAEEWGYIDDASKEHRSLDVFAYKQLSENENTNPALMLLIECKRSRHPYVFFKRVIVRAAQRFPYIAGIPGRSVNIMEAGSARGVSIWPAHAMGIDALPFVAEGPPTCASFSKAIPSGRKVELSGSDRRCCTNS